MRLKPPLAGIEGAQPMDFIERLFGVSPDGGSGLFEFLLFAVPLAGVAWLYWRRKAARRRDDDERNKKR
jgi:hypothetical protein